MTNNCPRGSPSPPTTVQIEGSKGGLHAVCRAGRLRVERTMKLLSALAGAAQSRTANRPANHARRFMASHSFLRFLPPRSALSPFSLSDSPAKLSPRNYASAWTFPPAHSHTSEENLYPQGHVGGISSFRLTSAKVPDLPPSPIPSQPNRTQPPPP